MRTKAHCALIATSAGHSMVIDALLSPPAKALGLSRGDSITSTAFHAAQRMTDSRQAMSINMQRRDGLPVFVPLPVPIR